MGMMDLMKKFKDSSAAESEPKKKMMGKDKKKPKGINMGPSKKFMLNKKLMTQPND